MDIIDIIIKACVAFLLLVFVVCLVLSIALVVSGIIKAAREKRKRKESDDLDCD